MLVCFKTNHTPRQEHLQCTQSQNTNANLAKEHALFLGTGNPLRCDTETHYRGQCRKGERISGVCQIGVGRKPCFNFIFSL